MKAILVALILVLAFPISAEAKRCRTTSCVAERVTSNWARHRAPSNIAKAEIYGAVTHRKVSPSVFEPDYSQWLPIAGG